MNGLFQQTMLLLTSEHILWVRIHILVEIKQKLLDRYTIDDTVNVQINDNRAAPYNVRAVFHVGALQDNMSRKLNFQRKLI